MILLCIFMWLFELFNQLCLFHLETTIIYINMQKRISWLTEYKIVSVIKTSVLRLRW
jgi:hypothetical protein